MNDIQTKPAGQSSETPVGAAATWMYRASFFLPLQRKLLQHHLSPIVLLFSLLVVRISLLFVTSFVFTNKYFYGD
jgi:hypothetical protein